MNRPSLPGTLAEKPTVMTTKHSLANDGFGKRRSEAERPVVRSLVMAASRTTSDFNKMKPRFLFSIDNRKKLIGETQAHTSVERLRQTGTVLSKDETLDHYADGVVLSEEKGKADRGNKQKDLASRENTFRFAEERMVQLNESNIYDDAEPELGEVRHQMRRYDTEHELREQQYVAMRKTRVKTKNRFTRPKGNSDPEYDKWQDLIDPRRPTSTDMRWYKKVNPRFYADIDQWKAKDHVRLSNKKATAQMLDKLIREQARMKERRGESQERRQVSFGQ